MSKNKKIKRNIEEGENKALKKTTSPSIFYLSRPLCLGGSIGLVFARLDCALGRKFLLWCIVMLSKLFHQGAWIVAKALMLSDASIKAFVDLHMGLQTGAEVKW
jgi:hypothetical protein